MTNQIQLTSVDCKYQKYCKVHYVLALSVVADTVKGRLNLTLSSCRLLDVPCTLKMLRSRQRIQYVPACVVLCEQLRLLQIRIVVKA